MLARRTAPWLLLLCACTDQRHAQPGLAARPAPAPSSPRPAAAGAPHPTPCVDYPDVRVGQPYTDEVVAAISAAQAAGLAGATVTIHRAYRYRELPTADGRRLPTVAVDVSFDIPCSTFDPDDLELVDLAGGQSLGDAYDSLRLTDGGEFADWRDPSFTDPHHLRALFVYAVDAVPAAVGLRYWEKDLAGRAEVRPSGPVVPEPGQTVLGWRTSPSPSGARAMQLVLVEASHWPRTQTPLTWLSYRLAGQDQKIIVNRWLEVDEALVPLEIAVARRPFLVPSRRFLVQFITPSGASPVALDGVGPLGDRATLRVPPATLAALLAAHKECEDCQE